MAMVLSTLGSPTYTGWKRRSSAASFSTCWRYSSSVVAPTTRNSPRASIGLGLLPASQRAPRRHRLEHGAGAHRTFRLPRPDERGHLVDEDDVLPLALGDLLEHGLEALLELAAELRAGDERAEVERDEALALEAFRDVAIDDALGEAFDDGSLADARLADEHGIVLRAT